MCGGVEAYEAALRERRVPRDRDVGVRLRRDPARGGDRVGLRAAERRVDRLRRLEPRATSAATRELVAAHWARPMTHPARRVDRRAPEGAAPPAPPPRRRRGSLPLGHLRHAAEPLAARRRGGRLRSLRRRPRPGSTSPRNSRHAHGASCATHDVDAVVSTGSAVALPFFALGRARGLPATSSRARRGSTGRR